ncbi:3-hydroxy-3-methylglutaryl-ACP synthase [Burkholderia sp. JP2-270]|uniref:hydroxymethylglutaryl-CoA synthase family protein n=1 Tax=Burkholderia sp. JP2-270 TaxID=2217913 RepID=UPI000DA285FB|nr:hydroxymethylglutaryl-CoA synthase [Burkholderia sp. JP2-270]AWV04271.1 3-hydroxy-3-methylglutaryl-ACP synthase [Burkholderia sp. JP2-270]
MTVGIEAIHAYVGRMSLGVAELFEARGLDAARMSNLLMARKSVNLPIEDPVTNGVNAAKPLIEALSPEQRDAIELVIVGTESGLDFGKPISTYIAHYLGLSRRCRSFEVKHACYGGTAALQMALSFVKASPRRDVKALVIAADASSIAARNTYWEPSQGAGAVAMLVSNQPEILAVDFGANGYHSFEVMDTLRPRPDLEAGDSDLSILSYMTCLEASYRHYCERVEGVDLAGSFRYLVLHTPFAGMVKSAHRRLLSRVGGWTAADIDADFASRVEPSIRVCQMVGNVYSAALYLALCSLLEHVDETVARRIGLFSYGSGCASEFYSGVVQPQGIRRFREGGLSRAIADRLALGMDDYERISDLSLQRMCGVQDLQPDLSSYAHIMKSHFDGSGLLVLAGIRNFHREYRWA